MRLKKILLGNFRSYLGETYIDIEDNVSTIIGKNDAGKSAILEALDIFFNDSRPELEDLCIFTEEKVMKIGCVFDDLPKEVTIDTTAITSLEEEYLLNEDGDLEIIKLYRCTEKTISNNPEIYIRALHPTTVGFDNLLNLKNEELKLKGQSLEDKVEDKRKNNLWRKVIWASIDDLSLRKTDLPVEEFEPKAQAMFTNLEALLPQFFLLKADRQATDNDSEAKDPMQLAVKEAQKDFQEDIIKLQNKIQEKVDEVAGRALEKLNEMDPKLAKKLSPVLKSVPKWNFDYKIQDDRGISLNKRGSGTRRLVLLNFFRAEAEYKSKNKEGSIIYAIEEPETSQHPDNQFLIMESLINLARDNKRQVLISTHSPQLAEGLPANSIKFVENTNEGLSVMHTGEDALEKAADSLGILAQQKLGGAKAIVVVEGNSDDIFLTHAAKVFAKNNVVTSNFEDAKILILPAGGSSGVKSWVQRYRLDRLKLPYLIFIDSEKTSKSDDVTDNEKFCQEIIAKGKPAVCTKKREIENYIDPTLIKNGVTYSDYDDVKAIISVATSVSKGEIIENYWTKMTLAQIQKMSKYHNIDGKDGYEIQEVIEQILSLSN